MIVQQQVSKSWIKFGWEWSGLVWFGMDEFGLVWMSLVLCGWVWFWVVEFGLVWLSSIWFDEVDFLKCSRSASQLSFTNLLILKILVDNHCVLWKSPRPRCPWDTLAWMLCRATWPPPWRSWSPLRAAPAGPACSGRVAVTPVARRSSVCTSSICY